jgi:Domain of unknown function (DUF4416)
MKNLTTPVKLFCGLIYREISTLQSAFKSLIKLFGPIDHESDIYDFDHTDYYQSEIGDRLIRKFISFDKLIHPLKLAEIKLKTIEIEQKLADQIGEEFKRKINIDPGYMELSKIILASTKNYSHRIYLDKGIYAEVTLMRQYNKFKFLQWTYPDYVNPMALNFFEIMRVRYKVQL